MNYRTFYTLFFCVFLCATTLFAGTKQILRVTLFDGTTKDYVVNQIAKITFDADMDDEMDPSPVFMSSRLSAHKTSEVSSSSFEDASSSSIGFGDINSSSGSAPQDSSNKRISSSSATIVAASSSSTPASATSSSAKSKDLSSSSAKSKNLSSSSKKKDALRATAVAGASLRIIPENGSIFISSNKSTPATLYFFTPQGHCLKKFTADLRVGLNQLEIDNTSIANGRYIIRVKTPQNDIATQFTVAE